MTHHTHPPTRRLRQIAGRLLGLALAVCTLPGLSVAGEHAAAFGIPAPAHLPEAILIPIRSQLSPGVPGWILTFRNTRRGPDAPDRETGARDVTATGPDGVPVAATIAWEILRTRNDRCSDHPAKDCPDTLRILSVPDGFIAVPKSAIVEEDGVLRVFIVPQGMS